MPENDRLVGFLNEIELEFGACHRSHLIASHSPDCFLTRESVIEPDPRYNQYYTCNPRE